MERSISFLTTHLPPSPLLLINHRCPIINKLPSSFRQHSFKSPFYPYLKTQQQQQQHPRTPFKLATALKSLHVAELPTNLNLNLNLNDTTSLSLSRFSTGFDCGNINNNKKKNITTTPFNNNNINNNKFMVIGHRGHGMNYLQSNDKRMKAIKENTISSFNAAAKLPLHFIEFDVQVTKDDCPVIFHDDVIVSEDNGDVSEKRITELSLAEFLSYGPQKESTKMGKPLLRKTYDGKIMNWDVETEDSLCTLREAFEKVDPSLGFNIELKFDDYIVYKQEYLIHVLQSILKVVSECASDRPIIFSSFQPDAIQLVRKLQSTYPVYFLTDGGTEIYHDVRRNSLEEAIKLCREAGLQGTVSEIKGVFRNPSAVSKIKDAKLSLLTYGKLNNVSEAVYMQHVMGIDGVIVDFVQEIAASVSDMIRPLQSDMDKEEILTNELLLEGHGKSKPQFSQHEMAFLLNLIPKLVEV